MVIQKKKPSYTPPLKKPETKVVEVTPKVQPMTDDEKKNKCRLESIEFLKKKLEKNPWMDKMYFGFSYDGNVEECTYVRFR